MEMRARRRPKGRLTRQPFAAERLEGRTLLNAAAPAPSAGHRDGSFSGDGIVTTNFNPPGHYGASDVAFTVAVAPDGKVVAAGVSENDQAEPRSRVSIAVARYNADGSPDATFGQGGQAVRNVGRHARVFASLVQPDGKIVLGGHRVLIAAAGVRPGGRGRRGVPHRCLGYSWDTFFTASRPVWRGGDLILRGAVGTLQIGRSTRASRLRSKPGR